jgi:hypothetical protein
VQLFHVFTYYWISSEEGAFAANVIQ